MRFSNWLKSREQQTQETSTSTGDVAHFARPFLVDPVDRTYPEPLTVDMLEKKKKKKLQELANCLDLALKVGNKKRALYYQEQLEKEGMHFFK